MSRRQTEAQDVEDAHGWLQQAVERLATAKEASQTNPAYETRCGLAQSSAEYAIKAVLVARRTGWGNTHNIEGLLKIAARAGEHIPHELKAARRLSQYGGTGSYGVVEGGRKPATKRDYRQAIDAARTVVEWAAKRVPAS